MIVEVAEEVWGSALSQRTKPPFRADHVGSLLRPAALKKAREQRAKGEIDATALKAIEDREIERVIKKQEEVGLQSITDGEFRRSWWHLDFLWGLDGVEKHVMDTGIAFAAVTTRNEGVKVTGKIGFSGHPMLEHFKFVAAHTKRTPKITIPAPSAIYGRPMRRRSTKRFTRARRFLRRSRPSLQKSRARLCRRRLPLSAARRGVHRHVVRSEIPAADEGPRRRSGRLGELYGDLINTAMSDIPSDMTITMHLCRGNYKSTFMGTGGYEAEQDILFNRIKVHGYFMEYDSDRAGGFEPLRLSPRIGMSCLAWSRPNRPAGVQRRPQAPHRRSGEIYFARPIMPVAAMRLCLDRGGQYLGRGRAMGQTADDCGSRQGSLGLIDQ